MTLQHKMMKQKIWEILRVSSNRFYHTRVLAGLLAVLAWQAMPAQAQSTPGASPSQRQLGTSAGPTPQDQVIDKVRFDQRLNEQVPLDLQFRDEEGKTVRLGQYFGKKPVAMVMIFYNCTMLCSHVLNEMMLGLKGVKFDAGKEFDVVVVSIHPGEGPELAKGKKDAYMKEYARPGTEHGWHFLTTHEAGNETNIKKLADAIGYHYTPDPNIGYAHPAGIVVATPQGKIARYFFHFPYESRDLRFGLIEAAGNKIGSPIDQIMMLCYHYNPISGKYSVSIMNVVRLAFCATVVLIGTFLVVMVRRDRRYQLEIPQEAAGTKA